MVRPMGHVGFDLCHTTVGKKTRHKGRDASNFSKKGMLKIKQKKIGEIMHAARSAITKRVFDTWRGDVCVPGGRQQVRQNREKYTKCRLQNHADASPARSWSLNVESNSRWACLIGSCCKANEPIRFSFRCLEHVTYAGRLT